MNVRDLIDFVFEANRRDVCIGATVAALHLRAGTRVTIGFRTPSQSTFAGSGRGAAVFATRAAFAISARAAIFF